MSTDDTGHRCQPLRVVCQRLGLPPAKPILGSDCPQSRRTKALLLPPMRTLSALGVAPDDAPLVQLSKGHAHLRLPAFPHARRALASTPFASIRMEGMPAKLLPPRTTPRRRQIQASGGGGTCAVAVFSNASSSFLACAEVGNGSTRLKQHAIQSPFPTSTRTLVSRQTKTFRRGS
ncbi:hypothetical protein LZ30DRAFT_274154 [Colletotrichum cereale]|nr:hypothetical protein LZ30DRAFT_274154 [Colletotrichum cereale]